jgi:hypothetical protein
MHGRLQASLAPSGASIHTGPARTGTIALCRSCSGSSGGDFCGGTYAGTEPAGYGRKGVRRAKLPCVIASELLHPGTDRQKTKSRGIDKHPPVEPLRMVTKEGAAGASVGEGGPPPLLLAGAALLSLTR